MTDQQIIAQFQALKQNYFVTKGQTDAIVEGMLNQLSNALADADEQINELVKENATLKLEIEKLKSNPNST